MNRKKEQKVTTPRGKPLAAHQSIVSSVGPIHHRLVGQFVVEWSKLEAAIDDLIWSMLALSEEDGRTITNRFDVSAKINVVRSLVRRRLEGDDLGILLAALEDADSLREDRNFVVHGVWGTLQPDNRPIALSAKSKSAVDEVIAQSFSPERMRAMVRETIQIRSAVIEARVSLMRSHAK